jgi:hypothetical protein
VSIFLLLFSFVFFPLCTPASFSLLPLPPSLTFLFSSSIASTASHASAASRTRSSGSLRGLISGWASWGLDRQSDPCGVPALQAGGSAHGVR